MNMIEHRISLDLNRADSNVMIDCRRGSTARELIISLAQGGVPYELAEGITAVFSARKSDGAPLFNACTVEQNTVRYPFTGQTTNVPGAVECEIWLYSGDTLVLVSPKFYLIVEDTTHQEGDIPDSSPEYTALTEMVSKGTELIRDLTDVQAGLEPIRDAAIQAAQKAEASANRAAQAAQMADASAREAAEQAAKLAAVGIGGAGKLVYIGNDGVLTPLALGPGLSIRADEQGVMTLYVSGGAGEPDIVVPVELTLGEDGTILVSGAEVTLGADGTILVSAPVNMSEDGTITIGGG